MSDYSGAAADVLAGVDAAIGAAVAAISALPDPLDRERAARSLTDGLLPAGVRAAKAVRQDAVIALREGRTLRQVSELLGLSVPRVDQLAKGR